MTNSVSAFFDNIEDLKSLLKKRGFRLRYGQPLPHNQDRHVLIEIIDTTGETSYITFVVPKSDEKAFRIDTGFMPNFDQSVDDTARFVQWLETPLRLLGMKVLNNTDERQIVFRDSNGIKQTLNF